MSSKLSNEEVLFLKKLGFEIPNNDLLMLEDDKHLLFFETVDKYLILKCFDENQEITPEGIICENILDKLSDI